MVLGTNNGRRTLNLGSTAGEIERKEVFDLFRDVGLSSIVIFQQFVIVETILVSTNAQHNFRSVDVCFQRGC